MQDIKMVVSDLDDTLLRADKTISSYSRRIIQEVRKRGVRFVFATARGPSTQHLVDSGLFDAYIQMNGARAYAEGQCIYRRLMAPDQYLPSCEK